MQFPDMEQKIGKKFFVFEIITFELGVASSRDIDHDTCNQQPMWDNARGDIFQINFPQNDEKKWYKASHGDFASIRDTFTCWLSKRFLKRHFLEGCLTKTFTVYKFGNILAMTIIFFIKMFKSWCRFQKWNKKLSKSFSFFR